MTETPSSARDPLSFLFSSPGDFHPDSQSQSVPIVYEDLLLSEYDFGELFFYSSNYFGCPWSKGLFILLFLPDHPLRNVVPDFSPSLWSLVPIPSPVVMCCRPLNGTDFKAVAGSSCLRLRRDLCVTYDLSSSS